MATLAGLRQVVVSDSAHALEHSLEVQLPFLQSVLDDFRIVSLAVGDASPGEAAEGLDRLWGGPETLIVQDDTFFHVAHGRLKLRQFADGSAELIHYHRGDGNEARAEVVVEVPKLNETQAALNSLRSGKDAK